MNVVAVVGNPKTGSRTRRAADMVAERLTGTPPASTVELAELGPALLEWRSPAVQAAKQVVLAGDLLVVASPVFKATYTGLLKLFLDQLAPASWPTPQWWPSCSGPRRATLWPVNTP